MIRLIKSFFAPDESIVGTVGKMADELHHSAEEKTQFKLDTFKQYEVFKKAQRFFMLIVVPPFMVAWLLTFGLSFTSIDLTEQTKMLDGSIGDIVWMIAVFYFGGGALEGIATKLKGK